MSETRKPGGRRRLYVSLATVGVLAVAAGAVTIGVTNSGNQQNADYVFLDGKVLQYTGSPTGGGVKFAEATVVTDGKISFIGSSSEAKDWIGSSTKVVNLDGKLLMPGIGDGHLHGSNQLDCDLGYEGGTVEDVLGKLKACLTNPEQQEFLHSEYVLSAGNLMGEGMLPSGARLDKAVLDRLNADPSKDPFGTGTTRPIVVANMDGHKRYTSSIAIANAGVTADTPDPVDGFIGREANGEPNGQFADYRVDFGPVRDITEDDQYKKLVKDIRYANSLGITQVLRPGGSESDLEHARRAADDGQLTVHLNQALSASDVRGADAAATSKTVDGLDALRDKFDDYRNDKSPGELAVDTVKIYCDGVPEYPGQTAAMDEPYRINTGTTENPVWVPGDRRGEDPSCENGTDGFLALDEAEWNIHVHSLGNRSTRVTVDNLERARKQNHKWDRRHAIAHLQFVNDEDIKRFGPLGIIASMALQWAQSDAWSTNGINGYLSEDVLDRLYPARGILDSGAVVAAGSDWPVTNLMPWTSIETAVDRVGEVNSAKAIYPEPLTPGEAITVVESVKAATIGVAYQMHQEEITGSIDVGKLADLIIVDQDVFEIPVEDISETKVLMTMLKGQIVFTGPGSPVGQ